MLEPVAAFGFKIHGQNAASILYHRIFRRFILIAMQLRNVPLFAAKLLCAIFCADFLAMLAMNVFRLYTHWLPILFFGLLAALALWVFRGDLIPPARTDSLSSREQFFLTAAVFFVAALFASVRIPYLLEGHLHRLVGPIVYDDTWHFQEINSLVNSTRYPAHCSLIPSRYFSLYYAPWMLIAALYLAIPVGSLTIKAAFAVGCAIYQILVCLSLLHVAIAKARSRQHLYWALYLVGAWAGINSIFSLLYYARRDAWWMMLPGTPIHFPIFGMGMVWAIHHMSAATALVLCWCIWDSERPADWNTVLCCGFLIGFTFYGSIFVFLGALPLGLLLVVSEWRNRWKPVLCVLSLSGVMIWPLVWLYLGKTGDVGFVVPYITNLQTLFPFATETFGLSGRSSTAKFFYGIWPTFFVFLIVLCLNFLPYVYALARSSRRLSRLNKFYVAIAIAFLISTYFVGFQEGDNYASRGYLVPILVLSWICAGLLPKIRIRSWTAVFLILGAFGSIHECIQSYKHAVYISRHPAPGKYGPEILAINEDRHTRAVAANDLPDLSARIYDVDKFVAGGKPHLVTADRQLECAGPRGPWRWQQIPAETAK